MSESAHTSQESAETMLSQWTTRTNQFLTNILAIAGIDVVKSFTDVLNRIASISLPDYDSTTITKDIQDSIADEFSTLFIYTELARRKVMCCGYYASPEDELNKKPTIDPSMCSSLSDYVETNICDPIAHMDDGEAKDLQIKLCTAGREGITGESSPFDYYEDEKIYVVERLSVGADGLTNAQSNLKNTADTLTSSVDSLNSKVDKFDITTLTGPYNDALNQVKSFADDISDNVPFHSDKFRSYFLDFNATLLKIQKELHLSPSNVPESVEGGESYFVEDISGVYTAIKVVSIVLGIIYIVLTALVIYQVMHGVLCNTTFCFIPVTAVYFCFLVVFCLFAVIIAVLAGAYYELSEFYYSPQFIDYVVGKPAEDAEIPDLSDMTFTLKSLTFDFTDILNVSTESYRQLFRLFLDYTAEGAQSVETNPFLSIFTTFENVFIREFKKLLKLNDVFGEDIGFKIGPYVDKTFSSSIDQLKVLMDDDPTEYVNNTVLKDPLLPKDTFTLSLPPKEGTLMAVVDAFAGVLKTISSTSLFPTARSFTDPFTLYIPRALLFFFSTTFLFFLIFPFIIYLSGVARTFWPKYTPPENIYRELAPMKEPLLTNQV